MRKLGFVNRDSDRKYLKHKLDKFGIENQVIIISGRNGIGKSALTDNFLSQINLPSIKVSINQKRNRGYDEGKKDGLCEGIKDSITQKINPDSLYKIIC